MKAEIITIGDELLIGQTVDTNSAWIGAELSKIGFEVFQITSISDKKDHILKMLSEVTGRSDVVLITGGLGPTSDDITKLTLCEFFGCFQND
jgi:nicotinamide-nucleotide amidase